MSTKKLFGNPDVLSEAPSEKDSLNRASEIKRVSKRIEEIVDTGRNTIVAYLAPFGTGKSSVLEAIKTSHQDYLWLNFEVWRYSNRKEIWDGFVIQAVAKLRGKDATELKIADEIEGARLSKTDLRALGHGISIVFIVWLLCSIVLWNMLHGASATDMFLRAYLKYSFPVVLTVLLAIGLALTLQRSLRLKSQRPLKRVFELENMLAAELEEHLEKPLVAIAEDVDRGSSDALIFLETLKSFMQSKTLSLKYPIIVIAPQTNTSIDAFGANGIGEFHRSLKIYDQNIYGKTRLHDKEIDSFYDSLKIREDYKEALVEATKIMVAAFDGVISMRVLKYALREVEQFVNSEPSAHPSIALVFVLARFVTLPDDNGQNEQPAQVRLMSGHTFNSGRLQPFVRALITANPKIQHASAGEYQIMFKDLEGDEIVGNSQTHPNPSSPPTYHIDVDAKYDALQGKFRS